MIDLEKIRERLKRQDRGYWNWRKRLPKISFTYSECIAMWHAFRNSGPSFYPYNLNRWIKMIETKKFNPDCPLKSLGSSELYASFYAKEEIHNELELVEENTKYWRECKFIAALVHYTIKALEDEESKYRKEKRKKRI